MYVIVLILFICLVLQWKKLKNIKQNIRKEILNNKDNRETYWATLIHDLKTPTFAQIRTMDMLLKGYFGNLTDSQKQVIKETLNSEKYMAELVTNILTAHKCDENELKLKFIYFNPADDLNNIYSSIKYLADEKKQRININYHCTKLICTGDKLQIDRVMTNLISNAIKYGFEDSTINITLDINEKELEFYVENQSQPIPYEKLTHIFDKYTGGMNHYNSAGTGLGLYLSKKIIDLHKGKIYANSKENGTCTFGFKIPIRYQADQHLPQALHPLASSLYQESLK